MVIFGAAGDLTKRLVVPAVCNLARSGQLSEGFQLVGVDLAASTRLFQPRLVSLIQSGAVPVGLSSTVVCRDSYRFSEMARSGGLAPE